MRSVRNFDWLKFIATLFLDVAVILTLLAVLALCAPTPPAAQPTRKRPEQPLPPTYWSAQSTNHYGARSP